VVNCGLGWTLLTLAGIDCNRFLLPDVLTLPLLMAGLTLTLMIQPSALTDYCLAQVPAYISFQGLAFGYRRLRGRDGLGGGDAELSAAAGAWCGLAPLPFIVLGSRWWVCSRPWDWR
jgi:leader peptidase (prepilin peptidase)/N-methyltransferase